MADEDAILDHHTLTDERVARDLAAAAHLGVLLDLHERSDLGLVADVAAIQIDELPEHDVLPSLTSGAMH